MMYLQGLAVGLTAGPRGQEWLAGGSGQDN